MRTSRHSRIAVINQESVDARGNPWLPPIDVLFETRDELVQFYKHHVVKLIVRREVSGRAVPGHGRSRRTPKGNARIFSVLTAIAPWSDSTEAADSDGIVAAESNMWVPEPLDQLVAAERDDEASDVRRLSSWPIRRTFVYVDVSDFSNFRPGKQALMVTALAGVVRRRHFWIGEPFAERAQGDIEAMLCAGDGSIFVFRHPAPATYFTAHLASLIEMLVARALVAVELHFRMGVHAGPVYCFWDPGREDWNYIGEGINGRRPCRPKLQGAPASVWPPPIQAQIPPTGASAPSWT
jgi:hypothetical protein